jgi:methionine-rich copper-binding protein CopC
MHSPHLIANCSHLQTILNKSCYCVLVKYLVGRKRIAAIFALALSIAPSTPTPATAHTKLLSEIPAAGSKVASWPTQITLEFDEQLQNLGEEKANFLVVNNAAGDGHPVEGEYTFTYGIGVETAEGVVEEETTEYPIAVYLASAVFIVSGLFFAIYSYRRRSRI